MFIYIIFSYLFLNHVNGYFIEDVKIDEECLNYTVYPVHYDLNIYSHDTLFYYGDITITVIANARVKVIELDAVDLDIYQESVGVWFEGRNIIENRIPYEYNRNAGKLYLYLKEELIPYGIRKNKYYIKISFNKHLEYKENGVFIIRYQEGGKER